MLTSLRSAQQLNVSRNERITSLDEESLLPVETKVDFSFCGITKDPLYDTVVKLQYHDLILYGNHFPKWTDVYCVPWSDMQRLVYDVSYKSSYGCGALPQVFPYWPYYFNLVKNLLASGVEIDGSR